MTYKDGNTLIRWRMVFVALQLLQLFVCVLGSVLPPHISPPPPPTSHFSTPKEEDKEYWCKLEESFLPGYSESVPDHPVVFTLLRDAQVECLKRLRCGKMSCGGITLEDGYRYTLRKGSKPIKSLRNETSWLRCTTPPIPCPVERKPPPAPALAAPVTPDPGLPPHIRMHKKFMRKMFGNRMRSKGEKNRPDHKKHGKDSPSPPPPPNPPPPPPNPSPPIPPNPPPPLNRPQNFGEDILAKRPIPNSLTMDRYNKQIMERRKHEEHNKQLQDNTQIEQCLLVLVPVLALGIFCFMVCGIYY